MKELGKQRHSFIVLIIAVAALLDIRIFLSQKAYFKAWFSSALTIVACTFFGVIGLYPNMFPSKTDPSVSLITLNSSSNLMTLKIMLSVVIIFIPIVIGYQIWTYNLFKGKLTENWNISNLMLFVKVKGLSGKVYVPGKNILNPQKHQCKWCGDDR